jgi:hypothetical protein
VAEALFPGAAEGDDKLVDFLLQLAFTSSSRTFRVANRVENLGVAAQVVEKL